MAQLGQRFDATAHDTEQKDFADLPNGIYLMEIEASEVAETSTGSGTILKTTNTVIEPEEFAGRKLFNNYNLENRNPVAQEIGQKQFASLCRAMGLDGVDDSEELHYKPFTVKIGLGKPSKDGQYPARAEIKRYYFPDESAVPTPEIDANQPSKAGAANDNKPSGRPAAAAAPQQRAAGARPWGGKK